MLKRAFDHGALLELVHFAHVRLDPRFERIPRGDEMIDVTPKGRPMIGLARLAQLDNAIFGPPSALRGRDLPHRPGAGINRDVRHARDRYDA
jgi:hypothetical protein